MNVRLQSLLEEAEARLSAADQSQLAELVETFVATHERPPDFTPEEHAHLTRLDAEPFEPADPAEVAALFARRA